MNGKMGLQTLLCPTLFRKHTKLIPDYDIYASYYDFFFPVGVLKVVYRILSDQGFIMLPAPRMICDVVISGYITLNISH